MSDRPIHVVGGGIAGLVAAITAAEGGAPVVLHEASGRLGGQVVGWPATSARDVHSAVAGRVFDSLGVLGAPVRVIHDGLSRSAYRACP